MRNLTIIILTHNDQASLAKTIESTKQLMHAKRIIIDDHSTDATVAIAKKYHIPFITLSLENDFAAQRNRALSKAPTDWVLFLDSDEILTQSLIKAIEDLPEASAASAYRINRQDIFWETKIKRGEAGSAWIARLVNKERGKFVRPVHEVWETHGDRVEKLTGVMLHYPHPTIAEFLEHINHYSSIEANYRVRSGKTQTNIIDVIITPLGKFIYTYIIKGGFRDGPAGFVYSFMMSFHSFLVRAKLYQNTDNTPLWQE